MIVPRRALLLATLVPSASRAAAVPPARLICPLGVAPTVLVPGVSDSLATRLVGSKLYRGLCRLDAGGEPQPDLAMTCTIAEDGLGYSFALRPGVTWHDGVPLTTDDVVFSLDQFHRALTLRMAQERVASVQAVDAQTVSVRLTRPFEPFLRLVDALSAPIVPRHVHDRPGWGLDPRETPPVGAGPFRMDGWLRLVRFDGFVGQRPELAEITFPVLPDRAARLAAMLSGQPALLVADGMAPAEMAQLRQSAALVTAAEYPPNAGGLAVLCLNDQTKPLDARAVRLALAAAIDRDALLRDGWGGLGRVVSSLRAYDVRAAASRLQAAGLRPGDDGVRARMAILVPPDAAMQRLATLLVRALALVGVVLTPEPVDAAQWRRRRANGDYALAVAMLDQADDPALDLPADTPEAAQTAVIGLVEPALMVVRDRRLAMPGGVYGSFADASLT